MKKSIAIAIGSTVFSLVVIAKSYIGYMSVDSELNDTLQNRLQELESSQKTLGEVKKKLTIRNTQIKAYQITEEEAKQRLQRDLAPLSKIGLKHEIVKAQRDEKYWNIIYIHFAIEPATRLNIDFYNDIYPITFKRMKVINFYQYSNKVEGMAVYYAI